MKQFIASVLIAGSSFYATAQEEATQDPVSVEPALYGAQIGLLGTWGFAEYKLANPFSFRTEVGIEGGIIGHSGTRPTLLLRPTFSVEPRWYFNFNRRVMLSKSIAGNSGAYLSLRTTYIPMLMDSEQHSIMSVPTIGYRQAIGNHFSVETSVGLGVSYSNSTGFKPAPALGLRFGYHL